MSIKCLVAAETLKELTFSISEKCLLIGTFKGLDVQYALKFTFLANDKINSPLGATINVTRNPEWV